MSAATRQVWVGAYLLAVLLVCLYLGFPSEALRAHVAHRLSADLPGLTVAIQGIRPTLLPPGVELQGARVSRAGAPLVVLERLQITPELLSLVREATNYRFQGSAAEGDISGTARVEAGKEQRGVRVQAQWAGVLLQKLPALQDIHGSRISGRMEGTLAVNDQGSLTGKLRVFDSQVELARPLFEQKTFSFKTLDADLTLQNQTLVLRNGRLRGNEMDAELSGTLALNPSAGAGALNLSGRATPHHAFMAKVEGSLPSGLMRRRAGISFRISGPLDAPGVSFN
jgi:type II secretion system protein N